MARSDVLLAAVLLLYAVTAASARAHAKQDDAAGTLSVASSQPSLTQFIKDNARTTARLSPLNTAGLYATSAVLSYKQYVGRTSYQSSNIACAKGFRMRLARDGSFALSCSTSVGTKTGGTSLKTFSSGTARTFYGRYVRSSGYNYYLKAEAKGFLYLMNGQIIMEVYTSAASVSAAVVNNTKFGANASSVWYAAVRLRRIGN